MKLYEIQKDYMAFMEAVERGDIPDEAIADTLEGIEGLFEDKADNIACLIKNELSGAGAIKAEIDALQKRMKAKQARAERLKGYLFSNMLSMDMRRIETARNRISIAKNPTAVIVSDEYPLIDWLRENGHADCIKTEISVRKSELGELLKDGASIPYAELRAGERLDIK